MPKNQNPHSHCPGSTKSTEPCQAATTAEGLCFLYANRNKLSLQGRSRAGVIDPPAAKIPIRYRSQTMCWQWGSRSLAYPRWRQMLNIDRR